MLKFSINYNMNRNASINLLLMPPKVAIVIPCYNVERHIAEVLKTLPDSITKIIAVNDCSKDKTGNILDELCYADSRLIVIHHERNRGVGGSMLTGFQAAMQQDVEYIIKMDGDGQMDAANIASLIRPLSEGSADFSKGNRFRDLRALKGMPVFRRIGNLGLSFMIKAASGYWNIFDPTNGFFAITKDTLKNINVSKIHNRYFFESSLLIELYHANAVICDVPMKARYGDEVSNLSITRTLFEFPPKLFMAFLKRIILKYFLFDFNIASLYILFGFPLFLLGFVYGLVNFIKYAFSQTPAPTGTVVIPTLLIILGFQLLLSAANFDITNYPKRNGMQ
jgi:dolichol-phosphate mannosyltransferase